MHSEDGAEDMRHGSITEWIDGNYVEMSKEARRYFLTTATRRTHGPPKLNVLNLQRCSVPAVVPIDSASVSIIAMASEKEFSYQRL